MTSFMFYHGDANGRGAENLALELIHEIVAKARRVVVIDVADFLEFRFERWMVFDPYWRNRLIISSWAMAAVPPLSGASPLRVAYSGPAAAARIRRPVNG